MPSCHTRLFHVLDHLTTRLLCSSINYLNQAISPHALASAFCCSGLDEAIFGFVPTNDSEKDNAHVLGLLKHGLYSLAAMEADGSGDKFVSEGIDEVCVLGNQV